MEIRVLTPAEREYTYTQSGTIMNRTGCIGHLRGDFDSSGTSFFTTWFDHREQWKTEEFKADLDNVINSLRERRGLLRGRKEMNAFIASHPESFFGGKSRMEYGFRVDSGEHAFLLRCNPARGAYNFYCYCYRKKWLDVHMREAEQGILFRDSEGKDKFRLLDGERIILTDATGKKREYSCHFIDNYHFELGETLYHIDQFAERMREFGDSYEPKNPEAKLPVRRPPKKRDYER